MSDKIPTRYIQFALTPTDPMLNPSSKNSIIDQQTEFVYRGPVIGPGSWLVVTPYPCGESETYRFCNTCGCMQRETHFKNGKCGYIIEPNEWNAIKENMKKSFESAIKIPVKLEDYHGRDSIVDPLLITRDNCQQYKDTGYICVHVCYFKKSALKTCQQK